ATEANPISVNHSWTGVIRVVVLPCRVRLPDFQHRIVNRRTIAVKHTKSDPRPFTLCIGACDASHAVLLGGQLKLKKWADSLRRRGKKLHVRFQMASPRARAARCRI